MPKKLSDSHYVRNWNNDLTTITATSMGFRLHWNRLALSVLKLIHATWLVELYTFFNSTKCQGKVYVLKGWRQAGIKDGFNGKEELPPVDLYLDIFKNLIKQDQLWNYI